MLSLGRAEKAAMIIGLNGELSTMSYVSKGQRLRKTALPVKETAVIKGMSMQSEGKVGFGEPQSLKAPSSLWPFAP